MVCNAKQNVEGWALEGGRDVLVGYCPRTTIAV
jgi:hypothetical protein